MVLDYNTTAPLLVITRLNTSQRARCTRLRSASGLSAGLRGLGRPIMVTRIFLPAPFPPARGSSPSSSRVVCSTRRSQRLRHIHWHASLPVVLQAAVRSPASPLLSLPTPSEVPTRRLSGSSTDSERGMRPVRRLRWPGRLPSGAFAGQARGSHHRSPRRHTGSRFSALPCRFKFNSQQPPLRRALRAIRVPRVVFACAASPSPCFRFCSLFFSASRLPALPICHLVPNRLSY
jgi:hypothetical protein